MQVGRFLFTTIGDVSRELGSQIHAEFFDDGFALDLLSSMLTLDRVDASITLFSLNRSLGIGDRETQLGGLDIWETDDAAMTDGRQAVTILHKCILQGQPLSIDKSLEREFFYALTITDVFFYEEAIEGCRFLKLDEGRIPLGTYLCFLAEVGLKHFVNHLFERDASQAVVGMDAAIGSNGEVEQQCRVAAHRFIVGVHQLRQTLDVLVFRFVVEPARTDARVGLARHPRVTVFQSVVQHGPGYLAIFVQQAPVGLADVSCLCAYPSQIASVAAIVPDKALGLQLANHLVRLGPLVISRAVNLARLVGSAIPAVAAIGTIEPYLEYLTVVRQ